MKTKHIFAISSLILILFFFTFSARAENKIWGKNIDEEVRNFELNLWSGVELAPADFDSVISHLNRAIRNNFYHQDSTKAVEKILNYVEKIKKFRMIRIFYNSVLFQRDLRENIDFVRAASQFSHQWEDSLNNSDRFSRKRYREINRKFSIRFAALVDSARKLNPLLINFLAWQKPIVLRQLQNHLSAREAILDYWQEKDFIAVFYIRADSAGVRFWKIDSAKFSDALEKVNSILFHQQDLLDLKFDVASAHLLYQFLFEPLKPVLHSLDRLVIIPDKSFWGLPFECLVSKINEKNRSSDVLYKEYQSMSFLIKKFSISYNYCLSALIPEMQNLRSQNKLGRRLLTLSDPVFSTKNDSLENMLSPLFLLDRTSDVHEEIRRVSRLLFRHDNLRGEQVKFDYLKSHADEYRWMYFAQIGILNDDMPLQSALMLSAEMEDFSNSGHWLDVNDVLLIPFRADMVTLSGTSLIPANKSNYQSGLVALPQAFLMAGNKSVLYSFWHVQSASTSEFMSKFYWELKYKRQHNTLALRGAKLASMRDTFNYFDKKISRAHPYFWAGFRLIGSPYVSSPSNAKIPPWGVVVIAYIALLIFSLIITRKTKARE